MTVTVRLQRLCPLTGCAQGDWLWTACETAMQDECGGPMDRSGTEPRKRGGGRSEGCPECKHATARQDLQKKREEGAQGNAPAPAHDTRPGDKQAPRQGTTNARQAGERRPAAAASKAGPAERRAQGAWGLQRRARAQAPRQQVAQPNQPRHDELNGAAGRAGERKHILLGGEERRGPGQGLGRRDTGGG